MYERNYFQPKPDATTTGRRRLQSSRLRWVDPRRRVERVSRLLMGLC